jgi:hypothetical protein
MRLRELRDAIDALGEGEPWSFTGEDVIHTLALIRSSEGKLTPPFADDLELPFPFLLVEHVAHVPESIILGFETLAEMEGQILSGAGFTNPFTTHCVAFLHGGARAFRIFYRSQTGTERLFSKAEQLKTNDFSERHGDFRLEWL